MKSAFKVAGNLVMVVIFTFQSVFGNSPQSLRHFSARGREESLELYSILWSDWPTSKQKVLRHGNRFAARVRRRYFRRERSDDRKCVCCTQATELSTPTESRHTTCLLGGKSPSVKLMSRRKNKKVGQTSLKTWTEPCKTSDNWQSVSQFFKTNCIHSIFRTIEARVAF